MRHEFNDVRLGVHPRAARPPLPRNKVAPFTQSTRVRQQIANRDWARVHRQLGEIFPRVVVERELAILHQQQHCSGRELLGHRT